MRLNATTTQKQGSAKVLYTACVFLMSSSVFSATPEFGRLFTSPEQRSLLDKTRYTSSNNIKSKGSLANTAADSKSGEVQNSNNIQLSGYILRNNGNSIVWVNGHSPLSGHLSPNIKTSSPKISKTQITVKTQGKIRSLKPGQTWSIDKNEVKESYETTPSSPPETDSTESK